MKLGEARKTVVFNLNKPEERAMYELSGRTNFGKLVKRYLSLELQRINAQRSATNQNPSQRSDTQ